MRKASSAVVEDGVRGVVVGQDRRGEGAGSRACGRRWDRDRVRKTWLVGWLLSVRGGLSSRFHGSCGGLFRSCGVVWELSCVEVFLCVHRQQYIFFGPVGVVTRLS